MNQNQSHPFVGFPTRLGHAISGVQESPQEDFRFQSGNWLIASYSTILTTHSLNLKDTNLDSLKIRREELCLKFARKCLKNERTKQMFPLRITKHSMKMREEEKYFVQHAKTERLKKSAIPYMQRLLNN